MHHVPESDYSVTIGGLPCTELDVNEDGTALTCLPPQSGSIFGQTSLPVTVSMSVLTAVQCLFIYSTYVGVLRVKVGSTHQCVSTSQPNSMMIIRPHRKSEFIVQLQPCYSQQMCKLHRDITQYHNKYNTKKYIHYISYHNKLYKL